MTLLLDIGNTRIKWSRLARGRLSRQRAVALRGDGAAALAAILAEARPGEALAAVNVAGAGVERALRRAARAAGLPPPALLSSSRAAARVANGYREPWRLGADRWAALLGARAFSPAPACVVDIGTALTVDFLDAGGRHHGGYIAPGPVLMVDALLRGTRGIRRRASGPARPRRGRGWPRATREALDEGSAEACAGLIARSADQARARWGASTRLLVTGGGVAALAGRLPADAVVLPDLVLRGLAAWAAADGALLG